MHASLLEYQGLMRGVVADGVVNPLEKRRCREFRHAHAISARQHTQVLAQLGWSVEEWDDGVHGTYAKLSADEGARDG